MQICTKKCPNMHANMRTILLQNHAQTMKIFYFCISPQYRNISVFARAFIAPKLLKIIKKWTFSGRIFCHCDFRFAKFCRLRLNAIIFAIVVARFFRFLVVFSKFWLFFKICITLFKILAILFKFLLKRGKYA